MQFEPGAPVAEDVVPLCVPEIGGNEWAYVKDCLDSGWVSSVGGWVDRFEADIAARVGSRFAVATVNGTAALHIALLVAGVEPDDEVLVSGLTFVAPANAIRYAGAWPVLVDAEPDYWQMDVGKVAEFLAAETERRDGAVYNRRSGRRISALLPVHILGHPVEMAPLIELAEQHGLVLVEDAAEALGARYDGRSVGTFGRIGCLSFNGNKLITTGGGGMIVTDDEAVAERARYLTTQAKDDPLEYVHEAIGFNYRLTNVQAAIGCAQLERLDEFVAAKRQIAATYAELLGDVEGIATMPEAAWAEACFWLYTVRVDPEAYGADSRALLARLAAAGIQSRPLWRPMHRLAPFAGCTAKGTEVADRLHAEALSLPCSVALAGRPETIERVARLIADGARRGG